MNIGFIGLGNMGHGMATNLLKAGHQITVYNRSPGKAEATEGARPLEIATPAEARQMLGLKGLAHVGY